MLKVSSLFSQILAEIPRTDFEKLVAKHGTQRHAKGFRSWTQFVAMLFCHLARAHFVARDMPRSFLLQRQARSPRSPEIAEQVDPLLRERTPLIGTFQGPFLVPSRPFQGYG